MLEQRTALVLGANGGSGFEIAKALLRHGWRVRALARKPDPARLPGAEWVQGDAMDGASVRRAATGASLIVHAVNPPGYRNWAKLVVPMIEHTIAAAEAVGARIVLPGTVYNYDIGVGPRVAPDAPQKPRTRKGRIRVTLEQRLETASRRGVRTLILRAGDFFGPHSVSSWLAQGLVRPGKRLSSVTYPGRREAGHAWAYLPDFAETVARLAHREAELPAFARFHFAGHHFARGVEMAERIGVVANGPKGLPIHGFPWAPLLALSPFVPLFREMAEMRYLWQRDLALDNTSLVGFLGAEPHTSIDTALTVTLEALGCLPQGATLLRELQHA